MRHRFLRKSNIGARSARARRKRYRPAAMPMRATTVRFGEDLWALLEREAAEQGVSSAQFVRDAAILRLAHLAADRGAPEARLSIEEIASGALRETTRGPLDAVLAAVRDPARLAALRATGALGARVPPGARPHRRRRLARAERAGGLRDASSTRTARSSPGCIGPRQGAVGERPRDAALALVLPARRRAARAADHQRRARGPGAQGQPRDPRPRRHRLPRRPAHHRPTATRSAASASSTTSRACGRPSRSQLLTDLAHSVVSELRLGAA